MLLNPVATGGPTRSTRNVRQSSRSRSKATRYHRLRSDTSRCGSTWRRLDAVVAGAVVEAHAVVAAGRSGQRHQDADVGGRAVGRTAGPVHADRHLAERVDALAQRARHHLHELRQGGDGGLAERRRRRSRTARAARSSRPPPRRRRAAAGAAGRRRRGRSRRGGPWCSRWGSRGRGAASTSRRSVRVVTSNRAVRSSADQVGRAEKRTRRRSSRAGVSMATSLPQNEDSNCPQSSVCSQT